MRYQEPPKMELSDRLIRRIEDILDTGNYTNGQYVKSFENAYRSCFKLSGKSIAVNGYQSGLMLVLKALGIKRPLVPDFTFSASVNAVDWACRDFSVGDCNLKTFNLRPKIPRHVDAVLPTHVFGNPCDCNGFIEYYEGRKTPIIYDAAHAHGATYDDKPIGDFGVASVFSLSPTKQVTSCEGGVIVTKDKELADKLRVMRNYGTESNFQQTTAGLNARMSEFHAVFGLESLYTYWQRHRHRLDLVAQYLGHFDSKMTQSITPNSTHAWKDFAILLGKDRDKVQQELLKNNIETKTYFRPISDLESYKGSAYPQKNSHRLFNSILQLPLHDNMTTDDVDKILKIVDGVV